LRVVDILFFLPGGVWHLQHVGIHMKIGVGDQGDLIGETQIGNAG
jgi:hypothetical protein